MTKSFGVIAYAGIATVCLVAAPAARADVLYTYQLTDNIQVIDENRGNLTYNASASGEFTYDVNTGAFSNINITFDNPYDNGNDYTLSGYQSADSGSNYAQFGSSFNPGLWITITGNFASDAAQSLTSTYVYVNNYATNTGNFSGSIDPVPEPASLTLVASGLIGVGALRRRRARRAA